MCWTCSNRRKSLYARNSKADPLRYDGFPRAKQYVNNSMSSGLAKFGLLKEMMRWRRRFHEETRGYDALVLVIDEDGISERVQELATAQQYAGSPIHRALGVAIRTFDAWMLA